MTTIFPTRESALSKFYCRGVSHEKQVSPSLNGADRKSGREI